MHDHVATTPGQPGIRYWKAGRRGPRVLFIMGFGMRGEIWQPQLEALKDTHQVAWYDHRGVGESGDGSKRIWSMADMAADALSVLNGLGWARAHLVGVSMGGMVAQEAAVTWPERILSLSLLVTHSGGPLWRKLPTADGLRAFAKANTTQSGSARAKALVTLLYPEHYVAQIDKRALSKRISLRVGQRMPPRTLFAQLLAILGHDTRRRLRKSKLPTLIIKAGQDVLVQPASADRLKRAMPHAELLVFPDAGHGVIWQKAKQVNAALARHIGAANM